jgi:putative copper export protein
MESVDAVAVGMRALAVIAALQAAGLALFVAVHRTTLADDAAALLARARWWTVAALVLVLAHQVTEGARLAGDWAGMVDSDTQRGNWHRSPGVSALVCAAGLAIAFAGCRLRSARGRVLCILGACGVLVSFALTGHTTGAGVSPLVRILLAVHVTIVSYWLGSIVALLILTRVTTTPAVYKASVAFSASAVWIVPAILPLGVGIVVGLVPSLASLRNVYGALLATKFTGFALLLSLAAFNRWRAVPALQDTPLVATRLFQRALKAEYALLIGVLSVTTVMTSLYSWH